MNELNLHGGNPAGRTRPKTDYYPTPADVTHALCDFFTETLRPGMTVWECACGEMDMANVLYNRGFHVVATDINKGEDFLKTHYNADAIITNPPFKIANHFIRKAVKESDFVAMLLKSQYWHAASRHQLFVDHPPSYVLPLTWRPDFLWKWRGNGKGSSTMEVQWNVWIRGSNHTEYHPLRRPSL